MSELQIKGQGCFQVGKGFEHQWDAIETLGCQAFEFEFGDHG